MSTQRFVAISFVAFSLAVTAMFVPSMTWALVMSGVSVTLSVTAFVVYIRHLRRVDRASRDRS